MSRFAFFSMPAFGHTNPTVEVVRLLTQQGHIVRYYSFSMFREKLEAAGAQFIPCDDSLPPVPDDLDSRVGKDFALLIDMMADTTLKMGEAVLDGLRAFAPDCVVTDSLSLWGKLFALRLGVPYVCSTTTFAFSRETSKLMKHGFGETLSIFTGMPRIQRRIKELRAHGYEVKNVGDIMGNPPQVSTVVYTSREFQPMADTFPHSFTFVGPSITGARISREERVRPLVYISLGTVLNKNADFYQNCIQALKDAELDVVMSVGERTDLSALGPIPPNFTVQHYVNQLEVLQRADVFLTHCGMNSASESLYFGVPTVMFPRQSEEELVARRCAELGAGLILPDDRPEGIHAAIDCVLKNKKYQESAARIGETFRAAGGARRAAEVIVRAAENQKV